MENGRGLQIMEPLFHRKYILLKEFYYEYSIPVGTFSFWLSPSSQ